MRTPISAALLRGGTNSIHEVGLAALSLSVRGPATRGEEPTSCSSRVLLFAEQSGRLRSRLISDRRQRRSSPMSRLRTEWVSIPVLM